jgi:hypothetical protein
MKEPVHQKSNDGIKRRRKIKKTRTETRPFVVPNTKVSISINGPEKSIKKKNLSKKSEEIKGEITNLFSDFFDAGKNNLTSGGVSPDQLAIAGKIIVKAGKLGINTFEQLVEWIRDNIGSEKLIENFDAIKSSYMYNLSKSNPNNESIEGISKFRLSETKKDTKGIP